MKTQANVIGGPLEMCSCDPPTGFARTGACSLGLFDVGTHVVCASMTKEFLEFTASKGNDLSTPSPANQFPGLKPGDRWCLCASRWAETLEAGIAPPVFLEACHASALEFVSLSDLQQHAFEV